MQPVPYLFFQGNTAEALRAYARVFGSPEPQIMLMGSLPEEQRMGARPEAVMHGAVQVDQGWIYGADDQDASEAGKGAGCVAVTQKTAEESRRIFDALAEGGQVILPISQTFWSPAFGMLTDRFGTRWMIDTQGAQMPEGTSAAPAESTAA
ncbi:PhnB protein, putative DNA binding protein 3-demethylubiquinone-9 3-methyltransferase domain protein [Rubellimicrobium mesophilum DSM 19309]|uniref:PhnB protein, putative DNA binding protein 3-demethylubiquinone-9 3-methyltransferase domain protein n=1 Tax=Rubellimicrobium mesophilum DSM 19309 TaxID=442562 RepID=A0A017HHQ6_9RHOB|nr:VOC family protein [Rubellimicrobium mesophilum]EYD73855.1 PhnB protein, putative DNA binding protein 3-demethylubiquinone-9 3-methyltransferase domain protein [Rubellimicrobium mesophilum DSM 19309]